MYGFVLEKRIKDRQSFQSPLPSFHNESLFITLDLIFELGVCSAL